MLFVVRQGVFVFCLAAKCSGFREDGCVWRTSVFEDDSESGVRAGRGFQRYSGAEVELLLCASNETLL